MAAAVTEVVPATTAPASVQPQSDDDHKAPTLLTLPAEIRLLVYEYVELLGHNGQKSHGWDAWCIDDRTRVTRANHGRVGLADLRRTCRQPIGEEVHALLYDNHDAFFVEISSTLRPGTEKENGRGDQIQGHPEKLRGLPTFPALDFLRHVQRVRIDLHLSDIQPSSVATELRTLERIIHALRKTPELRAFSFDPHPRYTDHESEVGLLEIMYALRRKSVREGVKAGKDMAQRELDFAQMVLEMLGNILEQHCGGDDHKFYRLFVNGPRMSPAFAPELPPDYVDFSFMDVDEDVFGFDQFA